ncbi:hypothetical protein [Streptomyces sp. VB1]|uniref:hypothetical protein n=1 Tax=Streptomyces sp. VB1 TaxID=2986803 RepID=UPI003A0FBF7B
MGTGAPHACGRAFLLEEAYWFGERVTPVLARRGLLATVPASPLLGANGSESRPATAPGGTPLLVAGGR